MSRFLRRLRAGSSTLGFSTTVPSEQTARFSMPTSTPTVEPSLTGGSGSPVSTEKQANHRPAVRLTVTSLMRPLNLRCSTMVTRPILGRIDRPAQGHHCIRAVVGHRESLLVLAPLEPGKPHPAAGDILLPLPAVFPPAGGGLIQVDDGVLG